MRDAKQLREELVKVALQWQSKYGVSPQITSAISEYDAAELVGCSAEEYARSMKERTAVSKGHDFVFRGKRYQIKANRPSGKKGSKVTLVPKAKNFEWDFLVWILYDTNYKIQEAWSWTVEEYKQGFSEVKRLSPIDMRKGKQLI